MLLGLLARAKTIPHRFVILFFTHALCITLGMAYANSWATRQALEVQADQASKREAAVGTALIEQRKADTARLQKAHDDEMRAANDAYAVLEVGMERAEASASLARRELSNAFGKQKQLEDNIDALKSVNKMLAEEFPLPDPSPGCVLPDGVRRSLDAAIARNNLAAGRGSPAAPGAAVPERNPGQELLTCRQLADGFIDGLDYEGLLIAILLGWNRWEESLR